MSITDELRHNIKGAEQLYGCKCKNLLAIADRIDAAVEGMVELPKDADDVPWNPGDCDEDGNVVITLKLASSGWYVITDGDWPYRPESKRHYHTLTVEDVLREFANGWDLAEGIGKADIYIKNFAAKLRLKED